jgi:hypothetical protein
VPFRVRLAEAIQGVITDHKLDLGAADVSARLSSAVSNAASEDALIVAALPILSDSGAAARDFAARMKPALRGAQTFKPLMPAPSHAAPIKVARSEGLIPLPNPAGAATPYQAPRQGGSFVVAPEVFIEGLAPHLCDESTLRRLVHYHVGAYPRTVLAPFSPQQGGCAYVWLRKLRDAVTLTHLAPGQLVDGFTARARAPTPQETQVALAGKKQQAAALGEAATEAVNAVEARYAASAAAAAEAAASGPTSEPDAQAKKDAANARRDELSRLQDELATYKEELGLLQGLEAAADAGRKLEVLQSMARILARVKELQAAQAEADAKDANAVPLVKAFSSSADSVDNSGALLMISGFAEPLHDEALLAFLDGFKLTPRHIWRSPNNSDICVELPAAWNAAVFMEGTGVYLEPSAAMGARFTRFGADANKEDAEGAGGVGGGPASESEGKPSTPAPVVEAEQPASTIAAA